MAGSITFMMIKPIAVRRGFIGEILSKVVEAGFRITALRMTKLTHEEGEVFYEIHKNKPFFKDLTDFISNGPIVVAILEKENAVADFRKLMGATDPAEAEEGTLRKLYGTSKEANGLHGSDSDESALFESGFFFSFHERFTDEGHVIIHY